MYTRFFSAATLAVANAVPELLPPNTMVRPWESIHSRAFEAAMSALFWWSALSNSIGMPSTLPPKSSIAICIASAPFLPSRSAYRLDMSVMKPILSLSGVCCAHAVEGAEATRQAMPSIEASTLDRFFMDLLLWMKTGDWDKRGKRGRGEMRGGRAGLKRRAVQ